MVPQWKTHHTLPDPLLFYVLVTSFKRQTLIFKSTSSFSNWCTVGDDFLMAKYGDRLLVPQPFFLLASAGAAPFLLGGNPVHAQCLLPFQSFHFLFRTMAGFPPARSSLFTNCQRAPSPFPPCLPLKMETHFVGSPAVWQENEPLQLAAPGIVGHQSCGGAKALGGQIPA